MTAQMKLLFKSSAGVIFLVLAVAGSLLQNQVILNQAVVFSFLILVASYTAGKAYWWSLVGVYVSFMIFH
jgi:hypothetical protein